MNVVPIENANLPEVTKLARSGTVILTQNGKPLAAVKDLSNSDWESVSLANNPRFRELIEASRQSIREQGGIPLEDLRKELGLKVPKPSRRHAKRSQRRQSR
jgi:hypothetical protein